MRDEAADRADRATRSESFVLATSVAICAVALLVEAAFGYPARLHAAIGHPVGWIGALIARLDRTWNRGSDRPSRRRAAGALAMAGVVVASGLVAALVEASVFALLPPLAAVLATACLASSCLAQRSLHAHVAAVAEALRSGGVPAGRQAVAMIVGRDVAALDEGGVARAAIESLAENFADGIVAPAFWLAALGLPGGVMYKAINTGDSMIAHRTPRHEAFGWFAARLDDIVNWPAARLAAFAIVLAAVATPGASAKDAWRVMRRDARGHASPNAGWPESAMAGALGITLGGTRAYAGRIVADAPMGDGDGSVDAARIMHALRLYRLACAIGTGIVLMLLICLWYGASTK